MKRMLSLALCLAACGGDSEQSSAKRAIPVGEGIVKTTQDGPVEATVSVVPERPMLGDEIALTLTVKAEGNVDIEMPPFGEALGRFTVVAFVPRQSPLPGGGTKHVQEYTLQATRSGRLRIPPLRIEMVDNRTGRLAGDAGVVGEVREILTDEIAMVIGSVLPEGTVESKLRVQRGSLAARRRGMLVRYWPLLGLVVLLIALAIGFVSYRRKARSKAKLSAYDVAIVRLSRLEAGGLPDQGGVDDWYVRLSSIVRRYLEDRYGLRAPELTTEEFLREAKRAADLTDDHRRLLEDLLEGCDRVKFAGYTPGENESKAAIEAAKTFILDTRVDLAIHTEEELARAA